MKKHFETWATNMKKLLLFALLSIFISAYAKNITIQTAGTLSSFIFDDEKTQLEELKIIGPLNSEDILLIRYMLGSDKSGGRTSGSLRKLDLSEACFVSSSTSYLSGSVSFSNGWSSVSGTQTKNDMISNAMFYNCKSLEEIILPSSIQTIGDFAFLNCSSLTKIDLPEQLESLGKYAFRDCQEITSITFNNKITSIPEECFSGCDNLYTLTIPSNVTSIAGYAFHGCENLSSIYLPDEVTTVAGTAFTYLPNLTKVRWSNNCKSMCLYGAESLVELEVPESVENLSLGRCYNLKALNIPQRIKQIDVSECKKITSLDLPIELKHLDASYCYGLNAINIPDGVRYVNLAGDKFSDIQLPESVDTLYLYNMPNLYKFKCPSKVTYMYISNNYFEEIHLPATLKTLYSTNNRRLKRVYAYSEIPRSYGNQFSVNASQCTLYVPLNCKSEYEVHGQWGNFADIIEFDSSDILDISVECTIGGKVSFLNNTISNRTLVTTVNKGEDVALTFSPDDGYELKSVEVNGVDIIDFVENNTYTITSVHQDFTINVVFKEIIIPTEIATLSYAIYADEISSVTGRQSYIPINLKNANLIATWQADLVLPEGLTIATDEYGDPLIVVSGSRTTAARHSIATSTVSGGATRILYNSSSNKTISGTDGEVATVTLNVAEDVEPGDYPIIFKNIVMSEANETGHVVERVVSKITIQSYTPGDVNNDGDINAQDLVAVVNYILENPTPGNIREAADLNNDGNVDAMDYVAEVNLILSDDTSSSRAMSKAGVVSDDTYAGMLSVESFALALGEEIEILVSLIDANASYTCCQFDVTLPEGICINDAESTMGSHSVAFRALGNGITRVFVSSPANKVMRNDDIAKLFVKADDMMMVGGYTMDIDNVLLVTPDAVAVSPAPAQIPFSVDGATGVANVETDSIENKRYNVTGQPVNTEAKGIVIVNGKMQFVK